MEQLILRDVQGAEELNVLKDKHIAITIKENTPVAGFYAAYNGLLRHHGDAHVLVHRAFSLLMLVILDIGTDRPDIPGDPALVDTIYMYNKTLSGSPEYAEFLLSVRSMLPFVIQMNLEAGRLFQLILFQRTPAELKYDTFAAAEETREQRRPENTCGDCGVYLKYGKDGHVCLRAPIIAERLAPTQRVQRNWGPVRFEWVNEKMCEPTNVPFTRTP